jgi:aspartate/methionine/tyrosine aminotransferase
MLERTIVLDSFSKTYAMTGWRCGYAAVPAALVEPFTRFLVNSTSCVPPFVQRAGVAALTGPQDDVAAMLAEFRARRELVVTGLTALPGVTCRVPHGAFYAFPNVESLPLSADVLAERLLEEAGVALLSGTAFGAAGENHLRLSYATSRERLAEGLSRMFAFLATL